MKSEKLKVKNEVFKLRLRTLSIFFFSLFTIHYSLLTAVSAQDDPLDLAPPPLKIISRDERSRLDAQTDMKARTKLALELMNTHLSSAEMLNSGENHDGMFSELGAFHALMDNSLDYLHKHDSGSGKVLDNFKRIDIGLRSFIPRLETIRRDLPLRYEEYVRKLIKCVRDARTRATEPLFADTVVPLRKPE